jgi:ribonuclease P/MRP protein subunit POP1
MAEFPQGKNRKRKHFEMEKPRQSPFQNPRNAGVPVGIVSKAPRGINAAEFAESRAMEIHNMMKALSSAANQTNKRVFQSLPRHMRRRAASHNPKRMPVRLRDAYNREVGEIIDSFCNVFIFLTGMLNSDNIDNVLQTMPV